jgi:hypothetical protein
MFRVCKAEEPSRTFITIDGDLSGDHVGAVELCCVQAMSEGKPVHLLLRDVPTVDQSGRALLSRMAAKGIHLLASGVDASYLVRRAAQAGAESLASGANNYKRSH